MNLKNRSDKALMFEAKALVQQESVLVAKILHYVREIDRRRLFSDYGRESLLDLVTDELGYSRDQALERIKAMRAMRDLPEIEQKLTSGEMNMTSVGIVQSFFNVEKSEGKPLTIEQKRKFLMQACGKSTREVQKLVFGASSRPARLREQIKMIGIDQYEMVTTIDEETVRMVEQLKGMLAHKKPNLTAGELIKMLGQVGLKEFARVKSLKSPVKQKREEEKRNMGAQVDNRKVGALLPISKAEIKRTIWKRDGHKCTICASTFAVQEDHIMPAAVGGEYTVENMRLLCRSCNQRAAIRNLGIEKIERFISN